ncbi:hypothetical protein [Chryseobacterium sp. Leaf394]|uniref:hypothetical protein n=1 Tax=Chryseobacterium sp. Leaf394 TaxID=1736361 RepID=UPI0006F61916|nr:hypothetical protein [Chryseobacterium sp. Leaf394]KQS93558.1 hypothetical protein ASG21_00880 [Chryseobacterium sp. Leaf394]
MKTLKLKVTISGGLADYGITYKLHKKGDIISAEKKEKSFEKKFTNLDGMYMLYIKGTGPATEEKKVRIELIYDDSEIDLLDNISTENPIEEITYEIGADYYFKTR